MTFAPNGREHFNLYYIFLEDKKRNKLPPHRAAKLWNNISPLTKPPNDND